MKLAFNGKTASAAALLAALGLSACDGNVKQSLGLSRGAPDEFAVTTAPRLEIPPDLQSLPQPSPGALPRGVPEPGQAASTAVFGQTVTDRVAAPPSALETQLISQAGGGKADPNIRAQLNQEHAEIVDKSTGFAQAILGKKVDPTDVEVDAPAEAQRLKDNRAKGLAPDQGEIPQINHGHPGLLPNPFN